MEKIYNKIGIFVLMFIFVLSFDCYSAPTVNEFFGTYVDDNTALVYADITLPPDSYTIDIEYKLNDTVTAYRKAYSEDYIIENTTDITIQNIINNLKYNRTYQVRLTIQGLGLTEEYTYFDSIEVPENLRFNIFSYDFTLENTLLLIMMLFIFTAIAFFNIYVYFW